MLRMQSKNIYLRLCKPCNSKHFQDDFDKWKSGNNTIYKLIQDAQIKFKDIKEMAKGGFETICGLMDQFGDGILNINSGKDEYMDPFFQILYSRFKNTQVYSGFRIYVWWKSRDYLKNIIHHDFHPGNILSSKFKYSYSIHISNFGLSNIIGLNTKKRQIFGVSLYIAPEVLSGEEYTKAADVYFFDVRITHRPTFLLNNHENNNEIIIQIEYSDKLSKNKIRLGAISQNQQIQQLQLAITKS
ncbi:hypothetical protein Glove_116g31 [Diversispora epigaea]|uniref:Protein kinase domain-containing protein n=1 Tax=Diversispora epigaea TaxID=1348612 RepID=A0A397J3F8_9GLOM|nr:hypothetical protein Glove_116g31 [Diversispora epigaea]